MPAIIFGIVVLISLVVSAIGHERDIYRQCAVQGNSGAAMWTAEIECKPVIK